MREYLNSISKLEFDKVKKHIQRYALSDLGREHLHQLIPSADIQFITNQLRLVSEMKQLLETDDYPPLENIFDIRSSIQRASIEGYILTAGDLHKIALVLSATSKLSLYFARRSAKYPLLFQVVNALSVEKIIEYNIRKAIDENGAVRDDASSELLRIRRQVLDLRQDLSKRLEQILRDISGKEWAQEEIITTRDGRMVIPVKVEHKNRVSGFLHSLSASGQTAYIEPTESLDINNEIRSFEFQEQREVERILRDLTHQVREVVNKLSSTLTALGELDFIHARAKYSIEVFGAEPHLQTEGELNIVDGYHPILLQKHKREQIVALNFQIGRSARTMIITGPNAGGKSVAMKTVGILTLLAQSGCHIPASNETIIRIFSEVFVDIGDEQSIENDLSSFSSHLSNLKLILECTTKDSLVLIDEIASGTDPTEGSSIAASVLEELTEKGCMTIVTTHHGNLKTFAFDHPHIINGAMEFNQKSLTPTYHFRSGVPGSSYAIEMAERMQFPSKLISRSRILKGKDATKLEDLILELERQSQQLKQELNAVNNERKSLKDSIIHYKEKITALDKEIKAIRNKAIEEANSVIDRANSTIENAVREIKEKAASSKVVTSIKREIQKFRHDHLQMTESLEYEANAIPMNINIGALVRLRNTNTYGEIVQRIDEHHYVMITETARLKVRIENIELISQVKKEKISLNNHAVVISDVLHEVDVRGMFGEEAINEVARRIDQALLHGLHRVDIIHGKGTGALRKRITEFLKNNSSIKSFRLGEWNEGGSGVTVVELQ